MMKNCKLVAGVALLLILQGCGRSKPTASDIEPYLMAELGQCPLWTISDVRKVDGIAGESSYRVDFAAKLTLKAPPMQALRLLHQHQAEPAYLICHSFTPYLMTLNGRVPTMSSQYEITGAADLVKSEKGWRLKGALHDYTFAPNSTSVELIPTVDKLSIAPLAEPENVPPTTATRMTAPESMPPPVTLPPCVNSKMVAWQKQRDKDMDDAAAAARAKGEELKTSAGNEALMEKDALDDATAACQGQQ